MNKNILIIGKGSSSENHIKALKHISKKIKIHLIGNRQFDQSSEKANFLKLKKIKFNYIIICSPSTFHYKQMKFFEKNFSKKKILIEKPLFHKYKKIPIKLNNQYFVGYNLRFHPVLNYIKKFLKDKNFFSVYINCFSYLPIWRKKKYTTSVSSQKKFGGGLLLELSHEIDYIKWIFKDLKILFAFNKKVSNLKIDCDDILSLVGKIKKDCLINLNMNFFSKIDKRNIIVNGDNFSLEGDLIKNEIILVAKKNKKIINFNNYKNFKSYYIQDLNFLNNRKNNNLCKLSDGLSVLKTLSKIKYK